VQLVSGPLEAPPEVVGDGGDLQQRLERPPLLGGHRSAVGIVAHGHGWPAYRGFGFVIVRPRRYRLLCVA
jgi:hypothetical protein